MAFTASTGMSETYAMWTRIQSLASPAIGIGGSQILWTLMHEQPASPDSLLIVCCSAIPLVRYLFHDADGGDRCRSCSFCPITLLSRSLSMLRKLTACPRIVGECCFYFLIVGVHEQANAFYVTILLDLVGEGLRPISRPDAPVAVRIRGRRVMPIATSIVQR